MNCRTEFGPEYAVPFDVLNVLLARGWEDTSWGNDTCPSFTHATLALILFVDAERMADREMGTLYPRFNVCRNDNGEATDTVFGCDDVPALLIYLATLEG